MGHPQAQRSRTHVITKLSVLRCRLSVYADKRQGNGAKMRHPAATFLLALRWLRSLRAGSFDYAQDSAAG